MKAGVEYSTIETCDDAEHVITFHATIAIEERVFLLMCPDQFMQEFRHLLLVAGDKIMRTAHGRQGELERLWENRVKIRLSERKMPAVRPITKEAIDAD